MRNFSAVKLAPFIRRCFHGHFLSVSTNATARRIALKEEIARTTTALRNANTAAEVQELTGVLIGLSSALNR